MVDAEEYGVQEKIFLVLVFVIDVGFFKCIELRMLKHWMEIARRERTRGLVHGSKSLVKWKQMVLRIQGNEFMQKLQ